MTEVDHDEIIAACAVAAMDSLAAHGQLPPGTRTETLKVRVFYRLVYEDGASEVREATWSVGHSAEESRSSAA